MLHEDYINLIIREELSRLINEDENPNSAQDQGFAGKAKGWLGRAKDWVGDKAKKAGDKIGKAGEQIKQTAQAAKDAINASPAANAVNQGLNKMADKNMGSLTTEQQQGIIAELVKYECLDTNTATELHRALFGGDADISYIAQAAQEAAGGSQQQQEGGQGQEEPSFIEEPEGEGLSDEMVQNMQGKLSEDGSNPYANITVNLSE